MTTGHMSEPPPFAPWHTAQVLEYWDCPSLASVPKVAPAAVVDGGVVVVVVDGVVVAGGVVVVGGDVVVVGGTVAVVDGGVVAVVVEGEDVHPASTIITAADAKAATDDKAFVLFFMVVSPCTCFLLVHSYLSHFCL